LCDIKKKNVQEQNFSSLERHLEMLWDDT